MKVTVSFAGLPFTVKLSVLPFATSAAPPRKTSISQVPAAVTVD